MKKITVNSMSTETDAIRSELLAMSDDKYRDFCAKLTPSVDKSSIIGVRMPHLRAYATQLIKDKRAELFLSDLPHRYFDENNLHALMLSKISNFDECISRVNAFLPFVDNWASCDSLRPRCFAKNKEKLLSWILDWLDSSHEYTVRFAIECLMLYYLDEDFDESYLELVANVSREEYYIRMMIAWYFATALAKRWEESFPYIASHRLDGWVHLRAIQKACESYRLGDAQKQELKKYR